MKTPEAILVAVLLCAAGPLGRTVTLTQQPGATLEKDARQLMASDIGAARRAHERPAILVGSGHLSAGAAALFVQVQSASLCGSAGCSTSVFMRVGNGWKRVLDSVSGPIEITAGTHHGLHDLVVDGHDRWVWDGKTYTDTLPAPRINLKPEAAH